MVRWQLAATGHIDCAHAQMRIERARQLLEAGADRANSDEAFQLEIMMRDTTKVRRVPVTTSMPDPAVYPSVSAKPSSRGNTAGFR